MKERVNQAWDILKKGGEDDKEKSMLPLGDAPASCRWQIHGEPS